MVCTSSLATSVWFYGSSGVSKLSGEAVVFLDFQMFIIFVVISPRVGPKIMVVRIGFWCFVNTFTREF